MDVSLHVPADSCLLRTPRGGRVPDVKFSMFFAAVHARTAIMGRSTPSLIVSQDGIAVVENSEAQWVTTAKRLPECEPLLRGAVTRERAEHSSYG